MFGFIKKIANTVGQGIGGVLKQVGLDGIVKDLAGTLGKIPGNPFQGLLLAIPDLLEGKADLMDLMKMGSIFLPPPANMIGSLGELDGVVGAVLGQVGKVDVNSPGGQNLLGLAQKLAFDLAGEELS